MRNLQEEYTVVLAKRQAEADAKNKELYEYEKSASYVLDVDYDDLVLLNGGEVVMSVTLGSYQGDLLYLIKRDNQYAFVVAGYGSCSYCDALQSCDDAAELQSLGEGLSPGEEDWKSAEDMLEWSLRRDWKDSYYYRHDDDAKKFVEQMNAYLLDQLKED